MKQNPDNLISAEERARRLQPRQERRGKQLEVGTVPLSPLGEGDVVQIQNQQNKHWDKTGTVICRQEGGHSYQVLEDGQGTRYSLRNRVHLRRLNQQPKKEDVVEPETFKEPKVPMPKGQEEDLGVIHLGTIPKLGPKLKVRPYSSCWTKPWIQASRSSASPSWHPKPTR